MKKTLLIVLLATSSLAHAGREAQEAVTYKRDCGLIGLIGKTAFTVVKKNQKPWIMPEEVKVLPVLPLAEWAVKYGAESASSEQDAYDMSYAKCEDNLAKIYRETRWGKQVKPEDLD